MKLTKEELDKAIQNDIQETIKEMVDACNLSIKGGKMLNENALSVREYNTLNEGAWESIKYGLSKLGRYKAGGKITGKGKIDQEAGAKIQQIIDKKGNEMINKLNADIKEKNPEFPNNKKGEDFLNTVMEIAAVYDSVVAATKKDPKEEGFLPVDAANMIIEDLAEYVKKFLDVDLSAAYSVMDSKKDKVKEPEGDEELLTDDVEGINEDQAADVRAQLQAKKGEAEDRESERMKGLKSNKLPLILSALGASLGALSWIAQSQWFKDMVTTMVQKPDTLTQETVSNVVDKNVVVDPNGWSYTIQNNGFNEATGLKLGPNDSVENLHKAFKYYGGGNEEKGMEVMSKFLNPNNQAESIANLKSQFADPSNKTVGDIFNVGEKTYGSSGHLFGQYGGAKSAIAKLLFTQIKKTIIKGTTTGVVKSALAKGLMKIGPILGPIGIGLVAAGATVKLMRMKGQKQSRAKTLQDLLNSIQPVKGTEMNQPVLPEQPKEEPTAAGETKKGEKTGNKEKLMTDLTSFFQFIVNNKKVLTTGTSRPSPTTVDKGGINAAISKRGEKMESIENNENLIFEARYIKDKRTYQALSKSADLPFNKLKKFEEYLTRLELIRNVVKKMGETDDKVLNGFIKKMKSNPIMATNFTKMFNVPSDNPDAVKSLRFFINDLFKTIYSGSFGKTGTNFSKIGGLVDKMGTLGGGNINKMEESYIHEEKGYNADEPNKAFLKDAQDRGSFKKNMVGFLTQLMNMFQYMYKLKKEGKLSGGGTEKKGEDKPKTELPKSFMGKQQESVKKTNPLLTEEVNKIKNLMLKIN